MNKIRYKEYRNFVNKGSKKLFLSYINNTIKILIGVVIYLIISIQIYLLYSGKLDYYFYFSVEIAYRLFGSVLLYLFLCNFWLLIMYLYARLQLKKYKK